MRSTSMLAIALLFTAALQASGLVTTDIFSDITWSSAVGAPYSDFVGSLSTNDVQFATDTGITWHPFGLSSFGADISGALAVSAPGTYTFSLAADDGAQLFVDQSLLINEGYQHPILTESASMAFTDAGVVPFQILYFQNGVGGSGVDLNLPSGISFTDPPLDPMPETPSLLLAGLGLTMVGCIRRRA